MKVKFYLKNPKKKESLIVARILWSDYQLPYSTKKHIESALWVKESDVTGERIQRAGQPKKYPHHVEINQSLDLLKTEIGKIFNRYTNENNLHEPTPSVLKELLDAHFNRGKKKIVEKKTVNFIQYFEDFIKRSENGKRINRVNSKSISKYTIGTYNTLMKHLKEYNSKLDWKDIDLTFHGDYTGWLMETYELANNSVGKDISIIKVVCSEAYYVGINPYDQFKNPLFKVSREESDSIHLNNKEINILWNLDLSKNKELEETRDLFILGLTTGLRYSDYSKIKSSQIDGYKLHVKTVKGGKVLEVNIRDHKAQAIIKRYKNILPQGAINQVFNKNLKDITKDIPEFQVVVDREYSQGGKRKTESLPKSELIKTHTARRSYCSNEVEAGTPIVLIMNNSGHTTEKSFWKYVKLNKSLYYNMMDDIMVKRTAPLIAV
jgi:integrase